MSHRLRFQELEDRTNPVALYVIVHGFQDEDVAPPWAFDMASAINDRLGLGATKASIDASSVRFDAASTAPPANSAPEFLVFDWGEQSRTINVADEPAIAGALATQIRARFPATGTLDLHIIGHSRGGMVALQAARNLNNSTDNPFVGRFQLTTLDPQGFGSDGNFTVASNVDWAENFYQTGSVGIGGGTLVPATPSTTINIVNVDLTDALEAWDGREVGFLGLLSEHSEVHDWYHWTIDTGPDVAGGIYRDPELNAQLDTFVTNPAQGRQLLFSQTPDLDIDGVTDDLGLGSKIGFHYSISEAYGPRSFTGFGTLDLVFVIDATTSMDDDIAAVKDAAAEMIDLVRRQVPDARFSLVTYRDRNPTGFVDATDYLARREIGLTDDASAVIAAIRAIQTGGNNNFDLPETVFAGLSEGIRNTEWRGGSARKAIILMGDATAKDPEPWTGYTKAAILKQAFDADPVDIFPIQSDVDSSTSSLFNSLAQLGGGKYFLAEGADDITDAVFAALTEITAGIGPELPRSILAGGTGDGSVGRFAPSQTGLYPLSPDASVAPFGSAAGPVRTATADVDNDGIEDSILVTGPGAAIRVAVISGADNSTVLVAPFDPFGGNFLGGGFVAAADIDGDGRAEFAVTPDQGGGPRVSIFSLLANSTVQTKANFFGIDDEAFRGGARAALGDIDNDNTPDLLLAAGFGGGPRVAVFDGDTLLTTRTKLVGDFFAFPEDAQTLRNGVFAALGDLNGDGFDDLVFGGGPGGGPRVYVLSGQLLMSGSPNLFSQPIANFFVDGNGSDRGGVRLAVKNADGDSKADLVVGSGAGSPAKVRVYLGSNFINTGEPSTFQDITVFGGLALADGVYVG